MVWVQEKLPMYSLNIELFFSQPTIYEFYNLSSDFSSELFSHF